MSAWHSLSGGETRRDVRIIFLFMLLLVSSRSNQVEPHRTLDEVELCSQDQHERWDGSDAKEKSPVSCSLLLKGRDDADKYRRGRRGKLGLKHAAEDEVARENSEKVRGVLVIELCERSSRS